MSKKEEVIPIRTPHSTLAEEAADWDRRRRTPVGFVDAPDAIPHAKGAITRLYLPTKLLELIKKFAERENVDYEALIERWLNDRVRAERERL